MNHRQQTGRTGRQTGRQTGQTGRQTGRFSVSPCRATTYDENRGGNPLSTIYRKSLYINDLQTGRFFTPYGGVKKPSALRPDVSLPPRTV